MTKPAMLIDARNALYRAIYAVKADNSNKLPYHFAVIFLRQIVNWINHVKPESIHVFWDAPRDSTWRRMLFEGYKDRSTSDFVGGISEELTSTTEIVKKLLSSLNVRQYERAAMEADDLIYTAVSVMHPSETVVVSTDSDMLQIPFRFNSSRVFNPKAMAIVDTPLLSPVHMKSLIGDKSDSIVGYHGIGPNKAEVLLRDVKLLTSYFEVKGDAIFNKNLLLIDLSLCPKLLSNTIYVRRKLSEEVLYSVSNIRELIVEHKLAGLPQEFNELIPPFAKFI